MSDEHKYMYQPRMMGAVYEYTLSKDSMDWSIGRSSGRVGYPMIRRMRLGYKPTNMATSRFMAEIWPANAPKLLLYSVSARSIIDTEDKGGEYARFLRELHRRVEAASPNFVFEAGFSPWRWWPSLLVGILTFCVIAYIAIQGLLAQQFLFVGIIGLIGGWFLWQIWNIVVRNRPRRYPHDAIPDDVLPSVAK
jgi:hypothetical protein